MTPRGLKDNVVLNPASSPAASALTTQTSGKSDNLDTIWTIPVLPISPNPLLEHQLLLLPVRVRVYRSPNDAKSGLGSMKVVCNRGVGNEPFDAKVATATPAVEICGDEDWGTVCTLVKIIVCHARLTFRLVMKKEYSLDLHTADEGLLPQVKSISLDMACGRVILDADSHIPNWGRLRR